LVNAIHQVLKGELYVSPQLRVEDDGARKPSTPFTPIEPTLTERQIEVLQLLAEGHSMKETAAVLNLAARTVAFHKYRLMGHLQLKNDAEVVQYALRHHVVFR
jgi:DNA-binding NarL/FixJ family response regulator